MVLFHCFCYNSQKAFEYYKGARSHHLVCPTEGIQVRCGEDNRIIHKVLPQECEKGLIPHPTTITRLCILVGVKGTLVEEETCPKVSPLTLTGVIKGPKSRKRKEIEIVEVAEEPEEEENEQLGMEQIPYKGQLPVEEEMQRRRSPLIHSPPEVRQAFVQPAECSRSNQGNTEIMEMLVSIKKKMEEREKR